MTVFRIFDASTETLFARASTLIAHHLTTLVEEKSSASSPITLGLCGGRSIVGLLSPLTETLESLAPRLHFYMVDERLVPLTHELSNFKLLNEALFQSFVSKQLMNESQIHPFQEATESPDGGVSAYAESLNKNGGRFDVCFLGVGEDGHIASLFPGMNFPGNPAAFYFVENSPKPPLRRITASARLIGESYLNVLLFIGEGKRLAYERFMNPAISVSDCPAKIALNAEHTLIVSDLSSEA